MEILVAPGALLQEGTLVLKMADFRQFQISAMVDEVDVGRLRAGMAAVVRSESFGIADLRGKIARIVPSVQNKRGVDSVEVVIDVSANSWEPVSGMTSDVRIHIDQAESVKIVPLEAVVRRHGKSVIFVYESGYAREHEVLIGLRNDSEAEIVQGVKEGEQVISGGQVFLQDGDPVQPGDLDSKGKARIDLFN